MPQPWSLCRQSVGACTTGGLCASKMENYGPVHLQRRSLSKRAGNTIQNLITSIISFCKRFSFDWYCSGCFFSASEERRETRFSQGEAPTLLLHPLLSRMLPQDRKWCADLAHWRKG